MSTLAFVAAAWGCTADDPSLTAPSSSAPSSASAAVPQTAARGPAAASRNGSTVMRSPDSQQLFLADEDQQKLHVFALPVDAGSASATIALPGHPAQLLATGNHVLVTIRNLPGGGGALLVLERRPGLSLVEVSRIALPADAWGIGLSPDEATALVSSAWTGKLSIIDWRNGRLVSTVDSAREPRGVTILPDGETAYVSHLVGTDVTKVSHLTSATPVVERIALEAAPGRSAQNDKPAASLGYAAVTNVDGTRVFFPRHALGSLGQSSWFGGPSVDVLVTPSDRGAAARRVRAPATFAEVDGGVTLEAHWAAKSSVAESGHNAFVQPRAALLRPSERTLLVASEGSDLVVELDATMSDPIVAPIRSYDLGRNEDGYIDVATKGGAPTGLALSEDERTLFVHCRGTNDLAVVSLPKGEGTYRSLPPFYRKLSPDAAERDLVFGRRLFFNATDSVTSGGLACAGCHPEGRDDGHVWHEVSFVAGKDTFKNFFGGTEATNFLFAHWQVGERAEARGHARQTPMIAGRVKPRGPYGWLAESPDLAGRLVAGFGLHRWQAGSGAPENQSARAGYLARFIREGLVPPARPSALSAQEQQGKELFLSAKTQCATCHTPDSDYTNRGVATFGFPRRPGFEAEDAAAYKTPSLLFAFGTAPYFHDGSAATLDDVIDKNADRMGKTSQLTAEEKRALVAFLKTL